MKKILYVIIISILLIGSELLAETFVKDNQFSVSQWTSDYLQFLDTKKEL